VSRDPHEEGEVAEEAKDDGVVEREAVVVETGDLVLLA